MSNISTQSQARKAYIISDGLYTVFRQELAEYRRACQISLKRWAKSIERASVGRPRYLGKTPSEWRQIHDDDLRAYRARYSQYYALYTQRLFGCRSLIPF